MASPEVAYWVVGAGIGLARPEPSGTTARETARGAPGAPLSSCVGGCRDQPMKSTPVAGRLLIWMVRVVEYLMPFQFCSETTNDVAFTLST